MSAVRYSRQPAFKATWRTYWRFPDPQAVRTQILAAKAELAQLQAPCSLPDNSRSYQHSMGERLSSTAWILGRPSVREVLKRADGGWFRTPSLSQVLVICALLLEQTWRDFMTNSHASPQPARDAGTQTLSTRRDAATSSPSFFSVMTQWRDSGHP